MFTSTSSTTIKNLDVTTDTSMTTLTEKLTKRKKGFSFLANSEIIHIE